MEPPPNGGSIHFLVLSQASGLAATAARVPAAVGAGPLGQDHVGQLVGTLVTIADVDLGGSERRTPVLRMASLERVATAGGVVVEARCRCSPLGSY
jgi:hypothetical protein